ILLDAQFHRFYRLSQILRIVKVVDYPFESLLFKKRMLPATLQILILLQQFLHFFPILMVWIFLHVLKVIVSYGNIEFLPKINFTLIANESRGCHAHRSYTPAGCKNISERQPSHDNDRIIYGPGKVSRGGGKSAFPIKNT